MSKAQNIRKRALELVRQQDWPNAIKEYRRLVELDQNNPNVHNELADLYLKTGQRPEAFDSFVLAVDEYTRVGLYNNAVAVCKKVLRVLPSRVEVLTKLGLIRMRQGLTKEAESYYLSFLEKAASGSFEGATFTKLAAAIAEEMATSPTVLQRLGQCLIGYRLNDEAGDVFIKLYLLQEKQGESRGREDTRAIIDKLGFGVKLDALRTAAGLSPGERTVVTEDTIWTKTHSEGERIDVESTPKFTPPSMPTTAPAPQPAGAVSGGPSERDQWLLRLARGVGGSPKKAADSAAAPASAAPAAPTATAAPPEAPATAPSSFQEVDVDDVEDVVEETAEVEAVDEPESAIDEDATEDDDAIDEVMPSIPDTPPGREPVSAREANPARPSVTTPREQTVQISALIQDDDSELGGEADYRSHYDLGMAYIEMDLLSEAIREYQIASKSPQFQVKCLEMIGLCFLKQKQPQLAIRQLTKGLSLIDNDSEEAMGIKYNLGLAYELVGDLDNARTHFEDVYVVDVTFRDVAEKISKLSGS